MMRNALLLVPLAALSLAAQPPATISDVVATALNRYPSVTVSREQLAAAAAGIQLARTGYLPRMDALAQVDRATRNNVFGLMLPQSVIPSISGPVLHTNNLRNVWGSAVGVLVSWEPFDFGLREANVGISEASQARANATLRRTQFEVASLSADAYLTLLAAEETVRAAQAGVDRSRSIEQAIEAVVKAELRPGADLSRAQAERAFAETQLIQARQAVAMARTAVSQFTGSPLTTVALPAAGELAVAGTAEGHPMVVEQSAAIDQVKAREKALDRSYYPKFNLQGSVYSRGSGANTDSTTGGAASGLTPDIQNWAVGMTVTFPVFDIASIRAKKQIEVHNERAEAARRSQLVNDLNSQLERARVALDGAKQVAQNTPVQLRAARATEQQATARYKAGLSSVIEVAEAQRLLTQAEIDDALARLNIWRAELAVAAATGDLEPFLASTRR